jgi:cation diffusion facilitator family transporter
MIIKINARKQVEVAQRISIIVFCISLLLVSLKALSAYRSGSVSVLGLFFDSVGDVLMSLTAVIVNRVKHRPASYDYPYGYGKSEALGILFQSMVLAGASFILFQNSFAALLTKTEIRDVGASTFVVVLCALLTLTIIIIQSYGVRHTRSENIRIDRLQYSGDFVLYLSALLSLYIWSLDAYMGFLVASYLAWQAYHAFLNAFYSLMDHSITQSELYQLQMIISEHPKIQSIEMIRAIRSGGRLIADCIFVVDAKLQIADLDKLNADLLYEIRKLETDPLLNFEAHAGVENSEIRHTIIG